MDSKPFPMEGLLPKKETEVTAFLRKYDKFDGRGVIVAILDTGVDPGAEGLKITSTGSPKIVDIVDTTGSGDVDTSTVVEPIDGYITGLTGRKLKIDPNWNNPAGSFHIGIKRGYELFPRPLITRLKDEKKKKWDTIHNQIFTQVKREITLLGNVSPSKGEENKKLQELEDRLTQLSEMQKNYDDPGPIYDIVAFNDGSVWRVLVDVNESGDLTNLPLLTDYKREHQYSSFGKDTMLNFSVNIYEDGNVVCLVTTAGSHGTHVAGIVAAYYPEQLELNGVAPGAQIVSIKIGDSRLSTMETLPGLIRGLTVAAENNCDLINLSYGEATSLPNDGRFIHYSNQVVCKKRIIFVSSAGNSGPCLSTVGAPGGTTSSIIGVGAYISGGLMEAAHSMVEKLPPKQYTWSSRGPTFDGHLGVVVSAPGGAISPVPNWTLQRNQLMEGTSMAAPSCTGGIALLLSGLKATGISYSPFSIRRSLENTATTPTDSDPFSVGAGLIQIDKCFTHLSNFKNLPYENVQFEVTVLENSGNMRGVYLREVHETSRVVQKNVRVKPNFPEDFEKGELNPSLVAFELKVALVPTQPWIISPDHVILMSSGRQFVIRIDATQLFEGAHFGEIHGFDLDNPSYGPIFRIPVTVIKATHLYLNGTPSLSSPSPSPSVSSSALGFYSNLSEGCVFAKQNVKFNPGEIRRYFVNVPLGATWIDMTITGHNNDRARVYIVHTVQRIPQQTFKVQETYHQVQVANDKIEKSFNVEGGVTIELCLAQYWSSLGTSEISFEFAFHGLVQNPKVFWLHGGDYTGRLDVKAPLRSEEVTPAVTLETLRKYYRPSENVLRPLNERDVLIDEKQSFELILTYNLKVADYVTETTPRFSLLNDLLYENVYEAQLWMVFDQNKRYYGTGDVFPEKLKLPRGQYTLKVQVRHDAIEMLEKLQEMVLQVDFKLKDKITLNCFSDVNASRTEKVKYDSKKLNRGESCSVFINGVSKEKLPKDAVPGDVLVGNLKLEKKTKGQDWYYIIPPIPKDQRSENSQAKAKSGLSQEELKEVKFQVLKKMKDQDRDLFNEILQQYSPDLADYVPFLSFNLSLLDEEKEKDFDKIIANCNGLLRRIDTDEIAKFFGIKFPEKADANNLAKKKKMEELKAILVDCLKKKVLTLIDLFYAPGSAEEKNLQKQQIEETISELEKWIDINSNPNPGNSSNNAHFVWINVHRKAINENYGSALKILHKYLAETDPLPEKKFFDLRRQFLVKLGWDHWDEYEMKWNLLRFPKSYPKF